MTQEHTPEPWRFVPWHIEEGPSAVRAPDGHLICSTASDANAHRIVACVNALAGISTEAIEGGVIAELKAFKGAAWEALVYIAEASDCELSRKAAAEVIAADNSQSDLAKLEASK